MQTVRGIIMSQVVLPLGITEPDSEVTWAD